MMDYKELKDKISQLDTVEKRMLIYGLLMEGSITYENLSMAYVNYLENQKKIAWTRQRMMGDCLAAKFQELGKEEFISARSGLLLQPHVDDGFIEKYVLKGISKEAIAKEREVLKREGI